MKKVISISEIVAPIQLENDLCEVWATADASYHEGQLEVKLDRFVRRAGDNEHLPASWLPETERESLSVSISKKEVLRLRRFSQTG